MTILMLTFPESYRADILDAFHEIEGWRDLSTVEGFPKRLRDMKAAKIVGAEIKVRGAGPAWARIQIDLKPMSGGKFLTLQVFSIVLDRALKQAKMDPALVKRRVER